MKYQNRRSQYINNLRDKEYRDVLVEESLRSRLAMQIRSLRKSRDMTQEQLAQTIGTKQEAVSRLENPDYGKYSLDTLIRLASAFDVALNVSFVSFSNLVNRLVFRRTEGLEVASYSADSELDVSIQDAATVLHFAEFTPPYGGSEEEVEVRYIGSKNG